MTTLPEVQSEAIGYRLRIATLEQENAALRQQINEALRLGEATLASLGPPAKPVVEKVIDHAPIDSPYKLSDQQAQDLRQMREHGYSLEAIGEHFGIHYTTVANYLKRESADRTTDARAEYSVMRDEDR